MKTIGGDLHTHTQISDGCCSVERNFQLAANTGLNYIAITDHDYLPDKESYNEFSKKYSINYIHGVEMSTKDPVRNRKVHILCYMPERLDELREICTHINNNRKRVGLQMAEMVCKKYPIKVEDIISAASESTAIFKQHIMQTLINAGFATEMYGELFNELFNSKTGSCLVNYEYVSVYDVLEAVKRSGGICVMAHPYTYNGIDFLKEIVDKGYLDGVEVWSSKSNSEQEAVLLDICKKNNLIPTGGSDFHGAYSPRVCPIGIKTTPDESIEALLSLKKQRQNKF